jgi:hypothetical protein
MSVNIRPFDAVQDAAPLRRFVSTVWKRPESDAYWKWWLGCPNLVGFVAENSDGEFDAVVFAIARRYQLGAQAVDCLETFDWYCRPELVGSGLGVFAMRELMRLNKPIVVLGASTDAESILRRLRFPEIATADEYWRPFTAQALRARGRGALLSFGYALAMRLLRGVARPEFPAATVVSTTVDAVPAQVVLESGVSAPMLDREYVRWLCTAPLEVGEYLPVTIQLDGVPAIWALLRVIERDSTRRGELLEWHVSTAGERFSDAALRAVFRIALERQCDSLHVATTDTWLQSAVVRHHFRLSSHPVALLWAPRSLTIPDGSYRIMGGRGDGAFIV